MMQDRDNDPQDKDFLKFVAFALLMWMLACVAWCAHPSSNY